MDQSNIVIYTKDWCPNCWRIRRLLKRKGYDFEEINNATDNTELRAWLAQSTGQKPVLPQVFINEQPVGGYNDISALDRLGELDRLVLGV